MTFPRFPIDWLPEQPELFCGGVATGVAGFVTLLADVTVKVVGQPLPVVLAAAAGAFVARSYAQPTGFLRALVVTLAWALLACACAPIAQQLVQSGAQKLFGEAITLPASSMAGIAALIASAPLWWPMVWPLIRGYLPAPKTPSSPGSASAPGSPGSTGTPGGQA